MCDEVLAFDFPRPFSRMAQLAAAYQEAVGRAHAAGHRRIVLAGFGIGRGTFHRCKLLLQVVAAKRCEASFAFTAKLHSDLASCACPLLPRDS